MVGHAVDEMNVHSGSEGVHNNLSVKINKAISDKLHNNSLLS